MKSIYTDGSFDDIRKQRKNQTPEPVVKEGITKVAPANATDGITHLEVTDASTTITYPDAWEQLKEDIKEEPTYIIAINSSKKFSLNRISKKFSKSAGKKILFDICFDHEITDISLPTFSSRIQCFVIYINQLLDNFEKLNITILFRGLFIIDFLHIVEYRDRKISVLIKENIINKPTLSSVQYI